MSKQKSSLEALNRRSNTFDPNVLVDPIAIGGMVVDFDFDSRIFEISTKEFKRAPNIISFCERSDFLAIKELFPRQIEILINLFEEYCPLCSDVAAVRDMWGLSRDDIRDKIVFLVHGRCPSCGKNKINFRNKDLLKDYNELVGIAGQRCLDPDTLVKYLDGSAIALRDVIEGDMLQGPNGPTKILKKVYSQHPGYFLVFPEGRDRPFKCSDTHQWKVKTIGGDSTLVTSDLKSGMYIYKGNELIRVANVLKMPNQACYLVDIEVEGEYFLSFDNYVLHNSGKSFLTGLIACYSLHRFLCLPIPASKYYGQELAWVRMSFVAKSGKQVKKTVWGEFKVKFDNSPWFKNYGDYLRQEEKRQGKKLYKDMETFIRYGHKLIECSYEVPNGGTLRGQTRFFTAIDELGYFNVNPGAKQANGLEVYRSLNNSLRTLRSAYDDLIVAGEIDPPHILQVNISSPNHETDPIMSIFHKRDKKPRSYMFLKETWMMNPTISMSSLKSEMDSDPVGFWRDYGARPGIAEDTWLKQQEKLDASKSSEQTKITTTEQITCQTVDMHEYYYVKRNLQSCPHEKMIPRIICCDAGELYNSYGMVIAHYDPIKENFILDGAIEICPRSIDGNLVSVSFPDAFDLIKQICEKLCIVTVVFDRWNSTDTIQRIIRDLHIKAYKYSPKFSDFLDFRTSITDGNWVLPRPEIEGFTQEISADYPIAKLIKQAKLVREVGKKLAKPESGEGDDLFRAWSLCYMIMSQNKQKFSTYRTKDNLYTNTIATKSSKGSLMSSPYGLMINRGNDSIVRRTARKPRI